MFPSSATQIPSRRSLRERVLGALDTALDFATLGEATLSEPGDPASSAHLAHPHRRSLTRPHRPRRAGAIPARAQVCTAPVAAAHPHC